MTIKSKVALIEKILPRLQEEYESCNLCFRKCGVNRAKGEKGFCRSLTKPVVYSYAPHHGEEPPLSGTCGSGTIFFSRCSMKCVYCQNYQFSQFDAGTEVSCAELSEMMLSLQRKGCHNINFVTPTHFVPSIVEALKGACSKGLNIPLVYNTGGYDSLHVIEALDGIIDIYMPDMRYSQDSMAEKYSSAPGYVLNNRAIVKEMYAQAGNLKTIQGIAESGLIIRLLVLPAGISGTPGTLEFIAKNVSKNVYLSVMNQYYPAYNAMEYKELSRRISRDEYYPVLDRMHELDLHSGWVQPFEGEFDERFAGENLPPSV
jgi:putative pyruvate formate lyase activating enzyme